MRILAPKKARAYASTMKDINSRPLSRGLSVETIELQLLLHCARSKLDTRLIRALVNEGINWDRLLKLARQHRVRPLLMRSLKSVCWDAVPSGNASAEVSMGCVPFNSAVSPIRKNGTNVDSALEIGV